MGTYFNLLQVNVQRSTETIEPMETTASLVQVKLPFKNRKIIQVMVGVTVLFAAAFFARSLMKKISSNEE